MSQGAVDLELARHLRRCTTRRLWAEQEEGPYHRAGPPARRDVTEDRTGTPLQLGILLADAGGAVVEIWHCDASGEYSGVGPPGAVSDSTFLRGSQPVDEAGMVEFRTIYPGWYAGRTVHIHLMVRTSSGTWTSQLYFPDVVTDQVHGEQPYASRQPRDTRNDSDTIFPTGGDPAVLELAPVAAGYRAGASLVVP